MIKRLLIVIALMIASTTTSSAAVEDYLILQDIGSYKLFTRISGRAFSGPSKKYSQTNTGGVLDATDHFSENDVSYDASYMEPSSKWPFVKVEVTQHAGSDSDKWLLHEVEDGYRDPEVLGALLTEGTVLRVINGNRVFNWGAGSYTWLSSTNIVVRIQYTDLTGSKPEPLEVVQAYLQKFPSTITLTDAEAKSRAHNEQWIKDEMDRRLWLCDRWFAQYQSGKVEQGKVLKEAVDHMNVFLDYREKYYGISAKDEKIALDNFLQQKNEASIKNKLTEYKTWWSANKNGAINLP